MIKTFKGKLSVIYLVLVFFSALVGLTSLFNLFKLGHSVEGLMTANYQSIKVLNQMLESLTNQEYAILYYINVDSKEGIDRFISNQKRFTHAYTIEDNNVTESGERILVNLIEKRYWEFNKSFAQLQEIRNTGGTAAAVTFHNNTVTHQIAEIRSAIHRLLMINERAMFRKKLETTKSAHRSMNLVLLISLLTVIGGFGMAWFFLNRFFGPIDRLKNMVKLIRAGDLNQQVEVVYQDEIGALASEFNNMTKRLMQYEQSTIGQLMVEKNKSWVIVKSISDPLIVMDQNYRIQLINDAGEKFFNIQEKQALDKHFLEVIPEGKLFHFISQDVAVNDEEPNQKVVMLISNENEYYFNVVVKKVKDGDSKLNGIVVAFHNITEIKQFEKVKTDFIATVSHEFKTPLTSMMMGLSLLENEKIGSLNPKQAEVIAALREDGESLTNLIDDLLEISKMEINRAVFNMQTCSIRDIIKKSVKNFANVAEGKSVNLKYLNPDLDHNVFADPGKITWVLNNLILNALKYSIAGETVDIQTEVNYDKLCVSVTDTGMGIPSEYQEKIFEKFVQVNGYDLEFRGTGLGLSIAKEIIEAHGGEIWCESKINEGSTFRFTLPMELK